MDRESVCEYLSCGSDIRHTDSWDEQGRVMSFYGPELQKYTSYKGHASESVHQILFADKGVLSIASHSVHFASRRGPAQWHLA